MQIFFIYCDRNLTQSGTMVVATDMAKKELLDSVFTLLILPVRSVTRALSLHLSSLFYLIFGLTFLYFKFSPYIYGGSSQPESLSLYYSL